MRRGLMFIILFLLLQLISIRSGFAEMTLQEEMQMMKQQFSMMQERMKGMERKIESQQQQLEAYQKINQPDGPLVKTPVTRGDSLSKLLEIGVVVDAVYSQNSAKDDTEGHDRLSVRELELLLGSDVDPFSRLDATIAFFELEAPSLEEAYLTRFALPLETTARIGKFKPKVGKVLTMHRDSLDTVDEPLVIQRYFSEEGFNKTGLDFDKILNLPIPITQQLSFGILEGGNVDENGIFGTTKRRPTLYGHLKNYVDITQATGFELGVSYLAGSRDEDASFEVRSIAADATLKHQFNSNQSLKIQGEIFSVERKESFVDLDEDDGLGGTVTNRYDLDDNFVGAYGLVDLRVHSLWSVGGRYDYVEPIPDEYPKVKEDMAYTGYVTFYQSEFARWRAQVTHTDLATGKDDNAVYLQGTFTIEEHKHKIQ